MSPKIFHENKAWKKPTWRESRRLMLFCRVHSDFLVKTHIQTFHCPGRWRPRTQWRKENSIKPPEKLSYLMEILALLTQYMFILLKWVAFFSSLFFLTMKINVRVTITTLSSHRESRARRTHNRARSKRAKYKKSLSNSSSKMILKDFFRRERQAWAVKVPIDKLSPGTLPPDMLIGKWDYIKRAMCSAITVNGLMFIFRFCCMKIDENAFSNPASRWRVLLPTQKKRRRRKDI